MIVLITYDLNTPGQEYSKLHHAIKELGEWTHPLESLWLVDTQQTPADIYKKLQRRVDGNDDLFVVELQGNWRGQFDARSMKWLEGRTFGNVAAAAV
jgi:CRISPR/Cas system-associated endoribonuclease Cas2